ncbi:MAG: HAD family hydrolase [Elusimicrobiota bacterium]
MNIRGVIFDMDGVIVDSELQWKLAEGEFLKRWAPAWREEDYRHITGLSPSALYDYLRLNYAVSQNRERFLADCQDIARVIYTQRVSLADGLIEILEALKKRGVAAAIASSSPRDWIDITLDRFHLREFFSAVASADDVGGRAKPLPDIHLLSCRSVGLGPSLCLAVEDSRVGVQAAKRAGLFCLGLRNGANNDQDFSAVDREILKISEIAGFLPESIGASRIGA